MRQKAPCATPCSDRDKPGLSGHLHDTYYTLKLLDADGKDLM